MMPTYAHRKSVMPARLSAAFQAWAHRHLQIAIQKYQLEMPDCLRKPGVGGLNSLTPTSLMATIIH